MIARRIAVAALIVSSIALLQGCGFPVDHSARQVPEEAVPEALRTPGTNDTILTATNESAAIWFVRDDVLDKVLHRVEAPVEAASVIADLLLGPTDDEQGRSFRSAIPDPAVVVDATVTAGQATVELTPEFAEIPVADQVLAVGQLVLTLTDLRGVGSVRFVVDDAQIAVPLPTGEASDQPVSRDDYITLSGLTM